MVDRNPFQKFVQVLGSPEVAGNIQQSSSRILSDVGQSGGSKFAASFLQAFSAAKAGAEKKARREKLGDVIGGEAGEFVREGGTLADGLAIMQARRQGEAQDQESAFKERQFGLQERGVDIQEEKLDIARAKEQRLVGKQKQTQELLSSVFSSNESDLGDISGEKRQAQALLLNPETQALGQAQMQDIRDREREQKEIRRDERKLENEFNKQLNKAQSPENAAKLSLVTNAKKNLTQARKLFFDEEGNFNESTALGARFTLGIPFTDIGVAGVGSDARRARSLMLNAINAQLRSESGAAVPESEVERAAERFLPSPVDSTELAREKLDNLQELLDTTLSLSKPSSFRGSSQPSVEQSDPSAPTPAPAVTKFRRFNPATGAIE